MSSLAALRGLVLKEIYHILRDRRTLFVVLAMPVVQMVLFGYALQTDVEEIRLVVVAPEPDVRVRQLVESFRAVPEVRLVAVTTSDRTLEERFRRGTADQAVLLEPGFASALRSGEGASALVVTDGTSPVTAPTMEALATGVLERWARSLAGSGASPARSTAASDAGDAGGGGRRGGAADVALATAAGAATPGIDVSTRFAFNPTLESQLLFVPGLLAFILTIVSALMTAITVAREKETGTLEVLLVSPLRPVHIVPGKAAPYLGLAFLNALSTLALARWVFGVPLQGSLALLLGECVLYVAVCLALGVLISTRTPTQRTAMLGVILGTVLPTAILSGMIFPIESMPSWLQPFTLLVPATWFIEVVRGIMLKGAALDVLWQETAVLAAMTAVLMAAGVRSLRARLG